MSKVNLKTSMLVESQIKEAWPENLFYNEEKVEDIYEIGFDKIFKAAGIGSEHYDEELEEILETQGEEVYLGYIPSSDTFISGVDLEEGMNTGSCSVEFRVMDNGIDIEIVDVYIYTYRFNSPYENSSGLIKMKAVHRDVIDIKLD